ncbi:GtrA family protein [Phycicoccus sp. MQZ13P-5]|uniref:GtrA family protein n=1 Tax=Phycicoccus sonneratiae TaxID=2807628 RepID=A0ABS2CNW9_9MICO|nr:GtrA family protein [Phycicoccus sonneraticus]
MADAARGARPAVTRELAVFAVVGLASTGVHLGGFVVLRHLLDSAQVANTVALLVAAVANTWANRRWTFGIRGRDGAARHQVQGLLVFALTLGMTSGGLALLGVLAPGAPTWVETGVVAATTAAATAVKYLAMRWWVFAPAQSSRRTKEPAESSKWTTPVQSSPSTVPVQTTTVERATDGVSGQSMSSTTHPKSRSAPSTTHSRRSPDRADPAGRAVTWPRTDS